MKTTTEKSATSAPGAAKQNLAGIIASHPLLKGLSETHLKALADSAMLKDFKKGETIFNEGDTANRFYLVLEGKVALETPERDNEPTAICEIGPGDVVGWSWLFPPYYWHFDARAVEPTHAIFFYGTRLREQCEQDKTLGYELMKRMAEVVIARLQSTRKKLSEANRRLHH